MRKVRPTVAVTLNLPDDAIADLDEVAAAIGFSGHVSLIRTYISEGLRKDLSKLYDEEAKHIEVQASELNANDLTGANPQPHAS